jgi:hypothetical protein
MCRDKGGEMKPIKIKIDVTKLDKARFFKGAKGTYCDLVAWPNKNGADQYGNTHSVKQDKPKDDPADLPFVGNLIVPDEGAPIPNPSRVPAPKQRPPADPDLDVQTDDVPF